jgi:hypothetical protein
MGSVTEFICHKHFLFTNSASKVVKPANQLDDGGPIEKYRRLTTFDALFVKRNVCGRKLSHTSH